MTIKLERYYKDCIRVDGRVLNEDERDYIRKTGFYYTLVEEDMGGSEMNVIHISGIDKFLERCKNDRMKIKCEGFLEEEYLKPKKEKRNNNNLFIRKNKKWIKKQ